MAKIILRLGSIVPLTENLDVGEPMWDADKAALGIGNGEKNPRFYPGIRTDGSLKLNGRKIMAPDSDKNYITWKNDGFSIYWNDREAFRVAADGVTVLASLTTKGPLVTGSSTVLPPGGTAGQVLTKASNANNDYVWATPADVTPTDPVVDDDIDGGIYDSSSGSDNEDIDGGVYDA